MSSNGTTNSKINKLDYPSQGARQPLLHDSERISSPPPPQDRNGGSLRDHFFEHVADGIAVRDRARIQTEAVRYISFFWSIISCLCAGSITTYSLYAPLFQTRLNYSQYQVTFVAVAVQFALYLLVPLFGVLCDRYGPRWPSLFTAFLFAAGYTLAALTYRSGPRPDSGDGTGHGWPVGVMILAFILIGIATSGLYLASVSTCAKNFAKSKNKGFALAAPIAAFGLSGMWLSQVGSKILCEHNPDGSRGDIDVFRYFIFLAGLCGAVGIIGFFAFQILDEDKLIDEAVEELERSGLLENSQFFHSQEGESGYGTMTRSTTQESHDDMLKSQQLQEARKKTWLLNAETHRFLSDPTMWLLAAGFFLVSGPGDAFIQNFGTVLGALYPSPHDAADPSLPPLPITTPATHITIIAIGSTIARLASGVISDLLSPPDSPPHHRRGPASLTASLASLDPHNAPPEDKSERITLSRLPILLLSMALLALGFLLLASGLIQNHASPRFSLVTALVGIGYGATFSLTPIIISCVWGVENFGTNWGIVAMVPAVGGAVWGLVYAAGYERFAGEDGRCYGVECYRGAFWGMTAAVGVAVVLVGVAWRMWRGRGIVV